MSKCLPNKCLSSSPFRLIHSRNTNISAHRPPCNHLHAFWVARALGSAPFVVLRFKQQSEVGAGGGGGR